MRAAVVSDVAAVRSLVPEWRALLGECARPAFTLTPEWLLTWWDVFGGLDGRALRVLTVYDGEQLVALAPLVARRHWYRPGLPFRRLEPLGTGEAEADSVCSDYLTVLCRAGAEADAAGALIGALTAGTLGPWDEVVVPLMDGSQPLPALLADAAQRKGYAATVEETTQAPYIPLPASWDAYLKALGKKERYLINRSTRDFEAWAGGEWRVEQATLATLEDGKRILQSLHQERWEGADAGVFRSARFTDFHDRVMRAFGEQTALELLWLVVRQEPVAAMYNIRWASRTYFYQCGRTLDVPPAVRPGGVLLYQAIRRSIEQGQSEFDFLGGAAVYKRQLALASRPLVQLRLARRTLVEQARRTTDQAKDWLRPLWRRLRRRGDSGPGIIPRSIQSEKPDSS